MRVLTACLSLLAASLVFGNDVRLPDAERVVLENGVVLILSPKHDVPLIGMEAVLRGGSASDPANKHGLANLLAGLLEKGAGDRSATEFAAASAAVGGEISASADTETINISADFMARDSALMVELVADMIQRPAMLKVEFEKLRDRHINFIKAAKGGDPGELMALYASAFLFGEHPYGNPVSGSEESLAGISHNDVSAYYLDQVGADRLVIAVSGDFDIANMRTMLSEAFSSWRPAGGPTAELDVPALEMGRRVYLLDKPGATQSYFYFGNLGVSRGYQDRAPLDLANTVFGGRFTSMLMTELRTKSGLSYSARSALQRYAVSGSVFITSFTATETTTDAIDLALATLGQFRDSGLDETMLESARNYVMGQFPPRFETAGQLAETFAALESQGLSASYIDEYGSALAAATPETVAAAIEDVYPSSENLVFVIIGDAELIRDKVAAYGPVTEVPLSAPRFHP